jgi:hypothetical protein
MVAVIQCASRKRLAVYLETPSGQPVVFVASRRQAPPTYEVFYAHPDDMSDYGWSWRDALLKYNQHPTDNPLRRKPEFPTIL